MFSVLPCPSLACCLLYPVGGGQGVFSVLPHPSPAVYSTLRLISLGCGPETIMPASLPNLQVISLVSTRLVPVVLVAMFSLKLP